ncbi:hypothetical protein JL100_004845 [Skermanella mucosa]|uniref:hypothetical protein n=1 Tax=Skermanella mucosa TaxID=1789672 RepID=UPI00192B43C4|nr:hypothetical protein [Skermanella mucosa]UEM22089.1 hypothetical protein JL100_004845 [Skermanella mucosa]
MDAFTPKLEQICRRPWLRLSVMGLRLFLKVSFEACLPWLTDTAATLSSDKHLEIAVSMPFFRQIPGWGLVVG